MIYLFDRTKELQTMIPRRHVSTATQNEVANGVYELSIEVPLFYETDKGKQFDYQEIVGDAWFAGHYDANDRFQLYKIHMRKVTANESGEFLLFDGVHIFFDEAKAKGNIHDRRWRDSEAYQPAQMAFNSIGWRLSDYDVTERADINFYRASVTDAWNHLIETYNIEFDYDIEFDGRKILNKNVIMKNRIGEWTGKRFAYGTNVMSLEQEQDEAEVYTAAVGRGRGEEAGEGHGPRLEFNEIEWSKNGLTKPAGQNWIEIPSATEEYGFWENGELYPRFATEVVFEDIEDPQLLADSTYQWLLENSVPKAEWKTEVARIGALNLGDGVGIIYKKAGIIKQARVQKIERNLLDNEQSKLTLGDYRHFKNNKQTQRLSNQINRIDRDSNSRITQMKNDYDQWFDEQETAINNAYEQAMIDSNANIDAAETRMTDRIESERADMQEEFDGKVDDAREYADDEIAKKESQYEQDWNQRDEAINQSIEQIVGGGIDGLDTSLLDMNQRMLDKIEQGDLTYLEQDISGVTADLNTTRDALQAELDDAKAELDNIEVGGRNLLPKSKYQNNNTHDGYGWLFESEYNTLVLARTSSDYYFDAGIYTVSYYAKIEVDYDESVASLRISKRDVNNTIFTTVIYHGRYDYTSEWKRFVYHLELDEPADLYFQIYNHNFQDVHNKKVHVRHLQVESGNMPTPWTPAPEDTEAKITTLNNEIEFVEGQLSAKLEQTDIQPLQDTVTDHTTQLEASASEITLLQEKDELIDEDITQWSNETQSNAEEINTALTRVSDTEDGLEQAENDITTNADSIGATLTEINDLQYGSSNLLWDEDVTETSSQTSVLVEVDDLSDMVLSIQNESHQNRWNVGIDYFYTDGGWDTQTIDNMEEPQSLNNDGSVSTISITFEGMTFEEYKEAQIQLEQGNTMTEYRPAREGLEKAIGNVEATAQGLSTDFESYKSETDGTLTTLESDISSVETTASGIEADFQSYTETTDGTLSSMQTDIGNISAQADGIEADFASYKQDIDDEVGNLSGEIASYEASVDGFRAEVGTLQGDVDSVDDWIAEKGAIIDGNADAISASVWQEDIDKLLYQNDNLIPHTELRWEIGGIWTTGNLSTEDDRIRMIDPISVTEGETYTFTDDSGSLSRMTAIRLFCYQDGEMTDYNIIDRGESFTFVATGNGVRISTVPAEGFSGVPLRYIEDQERIKMQLEIGDKTTPWSDAGSSSLKQTDFIIESDGFFLGGKYVGGEHYSTAILGSESGIDILAEEMRVTGDLLVKGDVEAYALSVVEGEFGRLFADEFNVTTIGVDDIQGFTAEFEYLYTLNANIETLVSQNVFTDAIDTMSINAVRGDIKRFTSEYFESMMIVSDWISGGQGLFDKVFINDAMVEQLVAKDAFVRTLNTITIDTDQISIRRPDGALLVNNGMANFDFGVQMTEYLPEGVEEDSWAPSWNGAWYEMQRRSYERIMIGSFKHTARTLKMNVMVRLSGYSPSSSEYMYFRIVSFGGALSYNTSWRQIVYQGEGESLEVELDLGRPTFELSAFYLEMQKAGENSGGTSVENIVQLRVNRAWLEG